MYLTSMKREADTITFTGQADNPNVISTFIRSLDGTQWLEKSAVVSIQQPNAVAYQAPTPAPAAGNISASSTSATLPEANYVTFVVTTMVKQTDVSATAASGVAASASKEK